MDPAPQRPHLDDGAVRGHRGRRHRGVPRHPVRDRRAVRAARGRHAVGRRARRHRLRADRPAGARAPSSSAPTSSRTSSASRSTCGRPAPTGRRPVMVWIHGGAFRTGSGASPLYEGTHARHPRRRRGDHDQLPPRRCSASSPTPTWPTTAAPMRQLGAARLRRGAALGAAPTAPRSAATPTTSRSSASRPARPPCPCSARCRRPPGLFHKAVVQSGAPLTSKHGRGRRAGRASGRGGRRRATWPRCATLPSTELLAVQQQVEAEGADRTFIPAVDGTVHPDAARAARIRDGSAAGIPMLIGIERRRVEAVGARRPAQPRPRRGPAALAPRAHASRPTRSTT